MKIIKIPDWLYEELLFMKNQYCLAYKLTSNIVAINKYHKNISRNKKIRDALYKWMRKADYSPEIPIGVMVKICFDSFVKFGVDKKFRDQMDKYILLETKQFNKDLS